MNRQSLLLRQSKSSISVTAMDHELLKRMLFVYIPLFTLLCLFSSFFFIQSTPLHLSGDETIIKYVIANPEDIKPNFDKRKVDEIMNEYTSSSDVLENNLRSNRMGGLKLDFIVAGYPKTGSTSLLHLFDKHAETTVAPMEVCAFNTDITIAKLAAILEELPFKSNTTSMQRAIKCPTSIWDARGLVKLSTIQNDLKLIVGVRHPVSWFQSYYNYRVTEMHDKKVVIKPPPPENLIGSNNWKGVSTDGARFELGLMQLGKIELEHKDLMTLAKAGRRIFPSKFKVFLYSIEQLEDDNEARSKAFRYDLQKFLGLKNEIESIPRSNVNHFVGESKHPETVNICEAMYEKLRSILVKGGIKTNRWIRSEFIHHMDVTIGGKNHFLRLIDTWESDPCQALTK